MILPKLIFCADGNRRHAEIAYESGWLYGARLPARGIAKLPLFMADQDWKKPNRERYMAELSLRKPSIATVIDWEEPEQIDEVLSWAEEAAQHVREAVLVIPKVSGGIASIPRTIGGKEVRLAYSVPSSHGASPLFLWEFKGWPVHLLGGSPHRQWEIWRYLRNISSVRSMDCNMIKKMATSRCLYWTQKKSKSGHWQILNRDVEEDGPDECVRRSAVNIVKAWKEWVNQ